MTTAFSRIPEEAGGTAVSGIFENAAYDRGYAAKRNDTACERNVYRETFYRGTMDGQISMVNIICSMRVREQNTMSMQTEFMFPGHHLDHLHWQRIIHIRIMRVDLCRAQDMALRCGI